ncbi:polysaccharide ABC transporter ATP-binding protein [Aquiflexum sp. LQ15W]|uniref:ABC transporter ATP-binding protein n=1 Tax=Cognataquiflexum nitidum TaxID=2922272 RepID=UPI001F13FA1A|nr:polysaccharide ABC transporter ATP-binding protein [Cognataquiflexum nitidum]MCH6201351.1 polysaccharide ABC transporter ATP-binding protein [Cognataquiflexum nitidum]
MSDIVIKVENISKQYRLGTVGTGSLAHDLNRTWYRMRGKEDPYLKIGEANDRTVKGSSEYVWALKDINFEVKQGEVLGIIGRNGAGKSTLLKILSRTTTPTTGKIKIKGRVASLLEVGTGFHPELSGRENIFLNGAILGMTRHEIKSKFDEIVDFAGVERYIDTPVKRYSSGMYVRLAFGVAAHLEPEILIVDEVLAVGDIEFQKKALGKMKDVSTKEGRTVLFVSHNLSSLKSLCTKGLLLINGEVVSEGSINSTINEYEKRISKRLDSQWVNKFDRDNAIYLDSVYILDSDQFQRTNFLTSEDVFIKFKIEVKQPHKYVKVGFDLIRNNEIAFRSQQVDAGNISSFDVGKFSLTCVVPGNLLNEGTYSVKPQFSIHCVKNLVTTDEYVAEFNVKMDTTLTEFHAVLHENNHPGNLFPVLKWEVIEI